MFVEDIFGQKCGSMGEHGEPRHLVPEDAPEPEGRNPNLSSTFGS